MWRTFICDTQTGVKKNPVRLASCSWARTLNAGASGSAVLPLLDKANSSLDLDDLLDLSRNTIVVEWDGVPVYAGLITDVTDSLDSTSVSIGHSDLWWLFGRRLAVDYTAPHVEDASQTYTALDLGTIAKRRVQLATTGDTDRNLSLPITYAGDLAGSITRTFYGYDLHWLADELTDILNEGPDIDFVPGWVSGRLNWLMRVGRAPGNDLTDGGPWEWRASGSRPNIFGVTRKVDGQAMANEAYVVGEGSEVDMLVRSSPDFTFPYPGMENVDSHKDVRDPDQASDLSQANIGAFKRATVQWGGSIMADGDTGVSDLSLGGSTKLWVQDSPRIPDGWYSHRLVGFSGDIASNMVDLQFQSGRS